MGLKKSKRCSSKGETRVFPKRGLYRLRRQRYQKFAYEACFQSKDTNNLLMVTVILLSA